MQNQSKVYLTDAAETLCSAQADACFTYANLELSLQSKLGGYGQDDCPHDSMQVCESSKNHDACRPLAPSALWQQQMNDNAHKLCSTLRVMSVLRAEKRWTCAIFQPRTRMHSNVT